MQGKTLPLTLESDRVRSRTSIGKLIQIDRTHAATVTAGPRWHSRVTFADLTRCGQMTTYGLGLRATVAGTAAHSFT